jgi:AraC-like DNA-binding protein
MPPTTEATGLMRDDLLLERYRYPPGPPVVLPRHSHEEYQLNLNLDLPGGVHYRGAYHVVPARRLAVIMPGEAHTPRDPGDRDQASAHLVLYVSEAAVRAAAAALSTGRAGRTGLPYFPDLIVDDVGVIAQFARLHAALSRPSSTLDQDVRLLTVLTELVERYAGVAAGGAMPPAHRAVRRAREYLHDNRRANVSLAELSQASELSPYRLTRLFSAALGMPPHSYQIQLRIEHAKRLLLAGRPVSETGYEAGFFDLSHFTRHFRRHVGVAPGAYARLAKPEARTYIPRR